MEIFSIHCNILDFGKVNTNCGTISLVHVFKTNRYNTDVVDGDTKIIIKNCPKSRDKQIKLYEQLCDKAFYSYSRIYSQDEGVMCGHWDNYNSLINRYNRQLEILHCLIYGNLDNFDFGNIIA